MCMDAYNNLKYVSIGSERVHSNLCKINIRDPNSKIISIIGIGIPKHKLIHNNKISLVFSNKGKYNLMNKIFKIYSLDKNITYFCQIKCQLKNSGSDDDYNNISEYSHQSG